MNASGMGLSVVTPISVVPSVTRKVVVKPWLSIDPGTTVPLMRTSPSSSTMSLTSEGVTYVDAAPGRAMPHATRPTKTTTMMTAPTANLVRRCGGRDGFSACSIERETLIDGLL
jgi:hypothetical protein